MQTENVSKAANENQKKKKDIFTEIVIISDVLLSLRNFGAHKSLSTDLFAKVYMVLLD